MIFPESKLPLDSQPWGREVTKQLSTAIDKIDSERVNNTARDNQLNSSIIANQAATVKAQIAADAAGLAAAKAQEAIDSVTSVEEAVYYPGTTEIDGGNIRANTIAANKISAGELVGFTIKTANTGQRAELAGSNISFFNSTSPTSVGSITGGTRGANNVIDISGMTTVGGYLWALGGLNVSDGSITYGGSQINGDIQHNGGNLFVNGGYLQNIDTYNRNVQSGRIMYVSSIGTYNSASSSERYKQDITPYEVDVEKLLLLEPVSFRYKQSVAEFGHDADIAHGFIAEQADSIGLTEFVDYELDEEGKPRPDNFRYIDFTAALLSVVKKQQETIKSFEARLEALESKV
jgi:hypothetical protein